ncbi:thioesterase family protein [Acrocarpospora catenulata]|uniref:thioesterase family protein n=1 Tax=Acrocarpospora catenulata TaxID=2836182 RepID=UPI001BD9F464|nr:hotdog domain-containing protein [Acrocarpospora catenulata]
MTLAPGLRAHRLIMVEPEDTAIAVGSGDVPVLATPRLLAFAEGVSAAAVAPALAPGQTSVGTKVALDHLAASGLGAQVEISAELTEVDGRRLIFAVTAMDGHGTLVATAVIERIVVDRQRFLDRLTR